MKDDNKIESNTNKNDKKLTRRGFLKWTTALAVAGAAVVGAAVVGVGAGGVAVGVAVMDAAPCQSTNTLFSRSVAGPIGDTGIVPSYPASVQ